jgi:autotransporter-associated beta strand protein
MKNLPQIPTFRHLILGTAIIATAPLHAATLYWDGATTTADADGGAGTWNAATNWDNAATGGADTAWNNTTPDAAVFGGVGGIVTLGAARSASGMTFNVGGYTIQTSTLSIGGGGITQTSGVGSQNNITSAVTLTASHAWTNESASTLTQQTGTVTLGAFTLTLTSTGGGSITAAAVTAGTGNVTISANTSVGMSANNTYSGVTTINSGGILTVNNLTNFGSASGLGTKSTNLASNLVIDGGTIRSQVSDGSSDRLFTVGANGAAFESTLTGVNSGRIQFTGSTAISYSGVGNRTITIGGNSDDVGGSSIARVIGDVGGGNGIVALAKTGAHGWTVSGTNTYTGGTTVSAGILTMGSASALGSTSGQLTVNTGGTLNMVANNLTVGNLTGTGGTISGTSGTRTLTIGQGNGTGGNFSGAIANGAGGTTALTKTGSGTITLSGANTYTGATLVSGGTLAVNGSLANTSGVTVGTGASLQGSGSINSSVTIQGNGTLASGNGIESLGTGALTFDASSTLVYEMNKDAAAGVAGDLTFTAGNLTLALTNDSILTLTELGAGSWSNGDKLTLISYAGSWNGGLFDYLGSDVIDDSQITFSGSTWLFNYNDLAEGTNYTTDSVGNFVTMTVIPEPSTALLGSIGLLFLIRRRR